MWGHSSRVKLLVQRHSAWNSMEAQGGGRRVSGKVSEPAWDFRA